MNFSIELFKLSFIPINLSPDSYRYKLFFSTGPFPLKDHQTTTPDAVNASLPGVKILILQALSVCRYCEVSRHILLNSDLLSLP